MILNRVLKINNLTIFATLKFSIERILVEIILEGRYCGGQTFWFKYRVFIFYEISIFYSMYIVQT